MPAKLRLLGRKLVAPVLAVLACVAWQPATAADAPIRIAFPSGMNGQIAVAMDKEGIARKNGLDAHFLFFPYGPPMMEALAAGSVDAVITSLMPVTSYAAKLPGSVKVVAMLGQSSYSLMVAQDSPIRTSADLAGATLGVSFGSDSELDTKVWLEDEHLAARVKLVNVAPADLATALGNKSVGAIVVRQPQVLRLQEQTGARIIHTWPFRFVSIVRTKFIAEHPKELAAYLTSLRESMFFIARHHRQVASWFGAYVRVSPLVVMQVSQDDPNYSAGSLSDIDIAVTPVARAIITNWAAKAYAHKMIRRKVQMSALLP